MWQTNEGGVRLALERLKWALAYPKRSSVEDWHGRVYRAVVFLQTAWNDHAAVSNSEWDRIFDPGLLPFTTLSQHFLYLRSEHCTLKKKLATLKRQVKKAQRPDLLCRRAEELRVAIERHLAAEHALACDEPTNFWN